MVGISDRVGHFSIMESDSNPLDFHVTQEGIRGSHEHEVVSLFVTFHN